GLSAILRAIYPANIGIINAKALLFPIFHNCSAKALYSELFGSNAFAPNKNTIAIKIPPAITSGNILETPFIKCLYIVLPIPCFSLLSDCLLLDSLLATNGLREVSCAMLISSSGRLMPSATGTSTTFLPLYRAVSSCTYAATFTPLAYSISSFVIWFFIPPEPFVSTLILTAILSACFFKASRAMYVLAIPVGQAVTANIYGSFVSAALSASVLFTSSASSSSV